MASGEDQFESRVGGGGELPTNFRLPPALSMNKNSIELTQKQRHHQATNGSLQAPALPPPLAAGQLQHQVQQRLKSTNSATQSQQPQQQQQQQPPTNNRSHPFNLWKIDRERRQQLIKISKWLCALILFALLVVFLTLVVVNNSSGGTPRASRANKFLERLSQSLNNAQQTTAASQQNQQQQQLEAGKLIASSSDDHFTMDSLPPDSLADLSDHDTNDDRDTTNQSQGNDNDTPDANQVSPVSPRQRARPNNGNRSNNNNDLRQQVSGRPGKQRDPDAICMTPGCVRAAAQILNNMDNNTKPCDDFYQFACGRWIATQVIPDEKTSLSVFSQNTADLNVKLRALVERPQRDEDPPIVSQMRNMYASCMNLSDIEARGDEPLLEVLRDLGGWPVLTIRTLPTSAQQVAGSGGSMSARQIGQQPSSPAPSSPLSSMLTVAGGQQNRRKRNGSGALARRQAPPGDGSEQQAVNMTTSSSPAAAAAADFSFSWLETLFKFRRRGFSHDMIIDLSVTPDVRNSRRYIIELDQSSLGLPDRSYYFKGMQDTTVSAYYDQMIESAVMLGAPRAEARKQMLEVLDFETSLAKISVPREQRRNVSRLYNKMVARDLYKLAPSIDWPRYLRTLLKDDQLDMDRDEVIVKVPSFLKQLDLLLNVTEPRVLANYMIWRIVRHSMSGLGRKWRELAHSFSTITTGRQVEEPRWEQCLGSIDNTLGLALSAFYVKNHFNERSKAAALEMVEYIREEFLRILDEIDWMDEETREEAKLKARGIATYIGYPDELLQDELVEEMYSGISMARTNFYANVRSLRVWSTDYAFGHLRKPNKRGDWKKHARAAVVNAYYNSLENSIEFPAGILQGAFFDAERPNYMNFGAIGYVIGHEITHGFDDRGRQFDRDGNDRNWWKPKTDARFKERAQCIIEQYGNFTLPEQNLRVNGLNTQGENIADNGGIKESFRAYRRWTKDHGREARLPGLEYSPDQLFWISAANIWCGKFRPEVLKLRINSGVHSPAKFRVVGPLSNSHEFAQSFNCPLGSAMNPRKKCSVW